MHKVSLNSAFTFDVASKKNKALDQNCAIMAAIESSETLHDFVLACSASGGGQRPSVLIFRRETLAKESCQEKFRQEDAWLNEGHIRLWIEKVCGKRAGNFLK